MKNITAKQLLTISAVALILMAVGCKKVPDKMPEKTNVNSKPYAIVDTGQTYCYNIGNKIPAPEPGDEFYGQDAQYNGPAPDYTDNGDGTITDNVTGLMWIKEYRRLKYDEAQADAEACITGGYTDWRVPSIKEIYSLMNFDGNQGSGDAFSPVPPDDAVPFINTTFFDFEYPSVDARYIDAHYITTSLYVSVPTRFFGLNLADGRIKSYGVGGNPRNPLYYARYVRGNSSYGINNFVDNKNNTITDKETGLTWMQADSGDVDFKNHLSRYTRSDGSLRWSEALDFCETLDYA